MVGIQTITDGTSNTVAFSEWRMGDFDQNRLSIPQDVVDNVPWPGGYRAMIPANNVAAFQQGLTNCRGPGALIGTGDNRLSGR